MRYFLGNLAHTNPNIPSNLYWAKIWCILLVELSQGPWIIFSGPTELKSSSPLEPPPLEGWGKIGASGNVSLPTVSNTRAPSTNWNTRAPSTDWGALLYCTLYTKTDFKFIGKVDSQTNNWRRKNSSCSFNMIFFCQNQKLH